MQLVPGERVAVGDRIGSVAYVEGRYVYVRFDAPEPERIPAHEAVSIPSFG